MGDPQVRNRRELSQLDSLLAALKRTVAQLPASSEIPVLVAGDIVFNRPKMHLPSKKSFAALGRPVFYAIGNHDHGPIRDSETPANEEPATRRFREHYGPTYYSFNRGRVHYIVLDNIRFRGGKRDAYDIGFGEEQLAWVERDLSTSRKKRAVVVLVHAPLQSRQFPDPEHYGDSSALLALLDGYARVQIISGHTHCNSVATPSRRVTEHTVGAACGGFWEGAGLSGRHSARIQTLRGAGTPVPLALRRRSRTRTSFSAFIRPIRRDAGLRAPHRSCSSMFGTGTRSGA